MEQQLTSSPLPWPPSVCLLAIMHKMASRTFVVAAQALVGILYPLYLRPVKGGIAQAGDSKLLHARFLPFLQAAKAAFNLGAGWKGALANLATQSKL